MVHRLDGGHIQVTVLNFSNKPVSDRISSAHLLPGWRVVDMFTERALGVVDQDRTFPIGLGPHHGLSLLVMADMPEVDRSDSSAKEMT